METKDNRFNILSLYKETKNKLEINEYIERENIDKPLMLSFLKGENIPSIDRKEKIVSPFLFRDIENDKYYPFIFCSTIYENNQMRLISVIDLNNIVKEILIKNSINIDITNISTIYDDLNLILNEKMILNKYSLLPFFSYFYEEVIEYNSNYPFISSYLFSDEIEEKYNSLFKEVKSNSFEKKIFDESYGFNARRDRVFKRIEKYSGTRVTSSDAFMIDSLIIDSIDEFTNKNESILFVYPKNKENDINIYLENNELKEIFNHSYQFDVDKLIQKKKNEEIRLRYQSFQNKREAIYKPLNRFKEALSKIDNDYEKINIDFSSYSSSDYEKDESLINFINSSKELQNTYIKNHHYYGLNCGKERNVYSSLQLTILNLISTLSSLINEIQRKEYFYEYNVSIKSFIDFDNLLSLADLVSQYSGFYKSFFNNDELSLSGLKEKYLELSSYELVLKKFFDDEFFKLDLYSLLKKQGIFKEYKIKKEISSHIKKEHKNIYKKIIDIVKKYGFLKKEIEDILPKYVSVYGENIKTFNGLTEIENEIEYINRCKEFMSDNSVFSFSHPLVKRIFSEDDFRKDFILEINKLKNIYSLFIDQYKKYEEFFEIKKDIHADDFDSLLNRFKEANLYSYEEFNEYLNLQEKMKDISKQMIEAIYIFIDKEKEIKHLGNDFRYSLLSYLYSDCENKFSAYENDYENIKKEYVSSLSNLKKIQLNSIYQKLEKKYSKEEIMIISSDKLSTLKDNQYDNVIVFMSEYLTEMNLLSSYRVGKKHLFISYSNSDKRIVGFHETRMNKDSMYFHLFDYHGISDSFLNTLNEDCRNNNAELILNSVYPFMIQKEGKRYALFPTSYLRYPYDESYIDDMAIYLSTYLDIKLISFDVFEYCLTKKGIFEYI